MKDNDTQNIFEAYSAMGQGRGGDTAMITLYDSETGQEVSAEVEYSVQDDSFGHEFGTENIPAYIVVDRVIAGDRDLDDEELATQFDTSFEQIARELEEEL